MKLRGLLVLSLCFGTFAYAQRPRRPEFRDGSNSQSFRSSRPQGQRESSREEFGDYGSPRERGTPDYDYDEDYDGPKRNPESPPDQERNTNQVYDYEGDRYNSQERRPRPRNGGSRGRTPQRGRGGGASHDDFADYSLGSDYEAVPEGRQGIVPRGPGRRGPQGPPTRHGNGPPRRPNGPPRRPDGPPRRPDGPPRHPDGPHRHRNGPPERLPRADLRQEPAPGFESFDDSFAAPPQFGNDDLFEEPSQGFRNDFNSPRGEFGGEGFDNRPPPREHRGPGGFRQGDSFDGPPFDGPRRPQPVVERGPVQTGGFGAPPVQEFLGDDNEITPAMLAELEQYGFGNLVANAPSPSRPAPAPRPVARAAPVAIPQAAPVVIPQPAPVFAAPVQQIQHAVAGIEARQASIQAVMATDARSASINSQVKAVTESVKSTEKPSAAGTTTTVSPTKQVPDKVASNIQIFNAAEVLGAADVTILQNRKTSDTNGTTAQPFLLTTTGLPVTKTMNITEARTGLPTTTVESDDLEMTTIPVTLSPHNGKVIKSRDNFLVKRKPKRKESPEYKYLKSFHSVYRGHVKKGGREACSMCSIEYCLATCSRVLKVACSGVDYDFESRSCTVHSKEDACSPLVPEGRTTHYVRIPCVKSPTVTAKTVLGSEGITALPKTTLSPVASSTYSKIGDISDEKEVQDVTKSPPGALKATLAPVYKINSKKGVKETSDTKADDFTFEEENSN